MDQGQEAYDHFYNNQYLVRNFEYKIWNSHKNICHNIHKARIVIEHLYKIVILVVEMDVSVVHTHLHYVVVNVVVSMNSPLPLVKYAI